VAKLPELLRRQSYSGTTCSLPLYLAMEIGQKVVCVDDDWWWVMPSGAKERMSPPNPIKDEIYTITFVEPCDWLQYGTGQNFLLSLKGFDRRYSHQHFRRPHSTDSFAAACCQATRTGLVRISPCVTTPILALSARGAAWCVLPSVRFECDKSAVRIASAREQFRPQLRKFPTRVASSS
jgi:hypothetical protein